MYSYRPPPFFPSVGKGDTACHHVLLQTPPFFPSVGEGDTACHHGETEETEGGDPNSGAEVCYHGYKYCLVILDVS